MAKDPAFLFYTSDFLTGTMFMTDEEVGVYIRLLCVQHQQNGSINEKIFNSKVIEGSIIRTKFKKDNEGYYNQRLLDEMIRREKKSNNLSENAKKRWTNVKKRNAIALQKDMPIENENENENKDDNKKEVNNKHFESIWNKYPNKDGKKRSKIYFFASVKTEKDLEDINKALNNYLNCKKVKEGFIKNGSTWFNNWQDWINYVEPKTAKEQQEESLKKLFRE